MQIKGYPPNISEIRKYLNPPKNAVFAYNNEIYNPTGEPIPEDLQLHEEVHFKQQALYTNSDIWWTKYLIDKEFRLDQELEAYHTQYNFLKKHLPERIMKEVLYEMAHALSNDYGLDITYNQAESRIKKYNVL